MYLSGHGGGAHIGSVSLQLQSPVSTMKSPVGTLYSSVNPSHQSCPSPGSISCPAHVVMAGGGLSDVVGVGMGMVRMKRLASAVVRANEVEQNSSSSPCWSTRYSVKLSWCKSGALSLWFRILRKQSLQTWRTRKQATNVYLDIAWYTYKLLVVKI